MFTTSEPSILQESTLCLKDAARRLPPFRAGRPVTIGCLMRWILTGVKTAEGPVKLEAVRLGGKWLTSLQALERFAAAQTPNLASRTPLPRTPSQRRRASERAAARLHKIGI
jgi:hypothetical protein